MTAVSSATLVIPSQVRLVDLVHCSAERMAEVAGFTSEDALDIGLAVREAAINAIRHGNRETPGTQVHVVLEAHPDGIRAWVRDEGEGFDPDATPDPTTEDHLLMTSGRGLLMIRAFVDDVEFHYESGRGMTVALSKKLKREGMPPAVDEGAGGPG